MRMCDCTVQGR